MKKYYLLSLFIFSAVLLSAQSRDSRNLSSFHSISVSEAIKVTLVNGTTEKAEVEVTGTDAKNVLTEVNGGRLKVHMANGNWNNVSAVVTVTYTGLDEIEVSSAAKVSTESRIKSNDMEIEVSSAGKAELALEVVDLEVAVSSAGKLTLEGTADNFEAEVSSAGNIDAYDLKCKKAEISASSAGSAKVTVSEEIDAEASGAGSIRYKGNPAKERANSSGGGSAKRVD